MRAFVPRRASRRGIPFTGSSSLCNICSLPLAPGVVSRQHHLFTTVDHIIPLAKGGKDTPANRALAHNLCNRLKGDRLSMERHTMFGLVGSIVEAFKVLGKPLSPKIVKQVRSNLHGVPDYKRDALPDLLRWEDEGGSVYQRPFWKDVVSVSAHLGAER